MSKMKELMLMMSMAGALGGFPATPSVRKSISDINNPELYKGRGFSGGQSIMRKFVINGVEIMATDKVMAKKKYKKLFA